LYLAFPVSRPLLRLRRRRRAERACLPRTRCDPMAHWGLRRVLLLVLLPLALERADGERTRLAARAALSYARAATRPHTLRRPRLAALWLAVARGEKWYGSSESFDKLDIDGDGLLTHGEFTAPLARRSDKRESAIAASIFAQADVDDDGHLNGSEFEFANFLATTDEQEDWLSSMEEKLPAGLAASIADMFDKLRRDTQAGKTHIGRLFESANPMLSSVGHGLDAPGIVSELFTRADITNDGALNLNELDYFQFMFRDIMVAASYESAVADGAPKINSLVESLVLALDKDGDGKFDEDEFARVLAYYFPEDSTRSLAHEHFVAADKDGDRLLDRIEAGDLVEHLIELTGL